MQAAPEATKVACSLGYTAIMFLEGRVEDFGDERRLAATAHACDNRHDVERETDIEVLEVVLRRADDLYIIVPLSAERRYNIGELVYFRQASIDYFASVSSGFGPHLNGIIGSFLYLIVMLDDDNGVAQVAELVQYMY